MTTNTLENLCEFLKENNINEFDRIEIRDGDSFFGRNFSVKVYNDNNYGNVIDITLYDGKFIIVGERHLGRFIGD